MNKLSIYILFMILLSSCGGDKEDTEDQIQTDVEKKSDEIVLSKDQVQAVGIKYGELETRTLNITIRANGYIEVPPQNKASITPFMEGYIKKAPFLVGDKVNKGQVLATIENPDYIKIQQEYLEILGKWKFLKTEYERQQALAKENINSKKKLLKAESDFKVSKAKLQGIKSSLEMMGIKIADLEAGKITSSIDLISPINGYVSKINVSIGKHVDHSDVLYEIINPTNIHVELNVFEKDILKVKKGQKITFSLHGEDEKIHEAEVLLVGKVLEEHSRTVSIHAHPFEKGETLFPGMYAEADIIVGQKVAVTVPLTALSQVTDKNAFIYMKVNEGKESVTYRKIKVRTGMKTSEFAEILFLSEEAPENVLFVMDGVFGLE